MRGRQEFLKESHVDDFGHVSVGGVASYVASEIEKKTGLESRHISLSHLSAAEHLLPMTV